MHGIPPIFLSALGARVLEFECPDCEYLSSESGALGAFVPEFDGRSLFVRPGRRRAPYPEFSLHFRFVVLVAVPGVFTPPMGILARSNALFECFSIARSRYNPAMKSSAPNQITGRPPGGEARA
jgi:hypothetical protein